MICIQAVTMPQDRHTDRGLSNISDQLLVDHPIITLVAVITIQGITTQDMDQKAPIDNSMTLERAAQTIVASMAVATMVIVQG